MSKAAEAVLEPYRVTSADEFIKLQQSCKRNSEPEALAQPQAAASQKPCSEAETQRLATYVQHVVAARTLMNAFYVRAESGHALSCSELDERLK